MCLNIPLPATSSELGELIWRGVVYLYISNPDKVFVIGIGFGIPVHVHSLEVVLTCPTTSIRGLEIDFELQRKKCP